jgi:ABC-type phosphate transport system permease subunit
MEVGLILFVLAIAANALARLIIWRSTRRIKETEMI